MNKLDIADELTTYTNQLDNITELMLTNINNLKISKCNETDRIYFLTDYIKQITTDLKNISDEITKDWCQMILINGIPASKELVTIFSMVKGATLENPVKTKDLKNATGLSERSIRIAINRLRFDYGAPIGSLRDGNLNGYYFITTIGDLDATRYPIQSQIREESRLINKLVDNFLTWNEEE